MGALFDMLKAGWDRISRLGNDRHEAMQQPDLICSPHTVIDADVVYTCSQSFLHCVCVSIFVHTSLCTEYMYILYARPLCLLVCLPVRLHISALASAEVSHLPALALKAPWLLICSPACPSLHPSRWGFHAPNREIHPHSRLCLQSEPSQSQQNAAFLRERQEV